MVFEKSEDTKTITPQLSNDERFLYFPSIRKMRLYLLAFAILYTFGIFSPLSDYNQAIFSFAVPALYIMSGFVVLRESGNIEKRILRTIGRTAICFAVLAVIYFALSFILEREATLTAVASKRFWFDFVVLNIWKLPHLGSALWYVQAMLYAYIGIYIFYKIKLLRFDIYIAVFCIAVATIVGELADVIGFELYLTNNLVIRYIGGNFLTRALPYILIGRFISRKEEKFSSLKLGQIELLAVGGVIAAVAEYVILTVFDKRIYAGHLLGMGLVAVALCLYTFYYNDSDIGQKVLYPLSRYELMIPYYVCSPLYYTLFALLKSDVSSNRLFVIMRSVVGLITLAVSFAILYMYAVIRREISKIKSNKRHLKHG